MFTLHWEWYIDTKVNEYYEISKGLDVSQAWRLEYELAIDITHIVTN